MVDQRILARVLYAGSMTLFLLHLIQYKIAIACFRSRFKEVAAVLDFVRRYSIKVLSRVQKTLVSTWKRRVSCHIHIES